MELQEILKRMAEKYPANYEIGMNPSILIYDDESGHIVKDSLVNPYEIANSLFIFSSLDELIQHLQEK